MRKGIFYTTALSITILLVSVAFADFILPGGDVSLDLFNPEISTNWLKDTFKLDPSHKDLINFSDPSYVYFEWLPNYSFSTSSSESTSGTLLSYNTEGVNELLKSKVTVRLRLNDKSFVKLYFFYDKMDPYGKSKMDIDGNGKLDEVETVSYNVSYYGWWPYRNSLDAQAFLALDLNAIKLQVGAGYERWYSPYDLKIITYDDGTKKYELENAFSIWWISDAKSYGNDRLDSSFKLYGNVYVSGLNVWAKGLYFEKGTVKIGHYIIVDDKKEPKEQCKYDDADCKDQWDYMKIRGTAGIDLNMGGIVVSPELYVYKYNSNYELYYRKDKNDDSSKNSEGDSLRLKPLVSVYIPGLEIKATAYYDRYRWNYISWGNDSSGEIVTSGASEIAYKGGKRSWDKASLDIAKKLSVYGLDTLANLSLFYYSESRRGAAYDKDKKEIKGNDVEYNWQYYWRPRDKMNVGITASTWFAKKFFNDKVAIGTSMKGSLTWESYKEYEYDDASGKVKVENQRSYIEWSFNPFSKLYAELKALDGLWIRISGSINGDFATDNPDQWLNGDYVSSSPTIDKNSNVGVNLTLSVKYIF